MTGLARIMLVVFSVLGGLTVAQAADEGFGSWSGLFLQGSVDENWGWYLETQTRLNEGYEAPSAPNPRQSRNNRFLLRAAARWLPFGHGRFQLHFGYAWTPNFSPSRDESRIYQQILLQNDDGRFAWALRGRLEERWIERAEGTAWRARVFARGLAYIGSEGRYGATSWAEGFWGLNAVEGGPVAGFDQSRVFLGPQFILSPKTRFEVGYMNNWIAKGRESDATLNHLAVVYAYLEL